MLPRVAQQLPADSRPLTRPVVDDLYSLVVGAAASNMGVRRFHLLYVGAERLARSLELDEVLAALAVDLEYTVANGARRKLFIEAGVAGWRGRALLVVGAPGTGTTTLITALVRAGATYYSGRYAVLDARGHVHPFAGARTPISDGVATRVPAVSIDRAPEERNGRAALPVGAIVMAKYAPGTRWQPVALSPGQAVLALLQHAVAVATRPSFALRVLERAVRDSHATLSGKRGEADSVADALLAAAAGELPQGNRSSRLPGQPRGQSPSGALIQQRTTAESRRSVT